MSVRTGYLLLLVVWLSWGLSYPLTAIVLRDLDVWTARCAINLVAAAVLLAVSSAREGRLPLATGEWRELFVAALFNISIFQIGMTYGVSLLSPGRTAVIIYTMPIWAALFARLMLGERLSRDRIAALSLGAVALVVLLDQDLSNLANAPLGAGLTMIAAASFGFGTVWMKRRRWGIPPTVSGGWQILLGTMPLLAVWAILRPEQHWGDMRAEAWLAMAYLVLAANVAAYIAWFRVITIFSATVSGIGTLAIPVIGVLSSAALVGEKIGWREILALALVCTALALVLLAPARAHAR